MLLCFHSDDASGSGEDISLMGCLESDRKNNFQVESSLSLSLQILDSTLKAHSVSLK
jgi:hypothetical protein